MAPEAGSKKGPSVDDLNEIIKKNVAAGLPAASVKVELRKVVPDLTDGAGLVQFDAIQRKSIFAHFTELLEDLTSEEEEEGEEEEEESYV